MKDHKECLLNGLRNSLPLLVLLAVSVLWYPWGLIGVVALGFGVEIYKS